MLQHVPRPEIIASYLREMSRTLKPGGHFLMHLLGRGDDAPPPPRPVLGDSHDTRYGWPVSRRELSAMIEAAGLVERTVGEGLVAEDMAESIRTDRVFSVIGHKP